MNTQTSEQILHLLHALTLDDQQVLTVWSPFPYYGKTLTWHITTHPADGTDPERHTLTLPEDFQFPGVTLHAFQEQVTRRWGTSDPPESVKTALLLTLAELGELARQVGPELPRDGCLRAVASEQAAEVLWYLVTLCNALDIRLQEALEANLEKLQTRYPAGFSQEQSVTRAL